MFNQVRVPTDEQLFQHRNGKYIRYQTGIIKVKTRIPKSKIQQWGLITEYVKQIKTANSRTDH